MLNIEEFAKSGELFDGRYKLLRTLSTDGGSADVWLALDVNTVNTPLEEAGKTIDKADDVEDGIQVAIKIYRPKNALDIEGEQKFREEYKIVYNCHHANLLQPTNFSIFREIPYLVLPYCKNGSSELLIHKDPVIENLWKYVGDVAAGLSYLHNCTPPIIHQDIKPANVLIDDNNHFTITDFGISAQSGGKHGYAGDDNSGTFAYMAPERFTDNPVPLAASDVWAFGATLYEIITGHVPYGEDGGLAQPDGKVKLPFPDKGLSSDFKRMVIACLDRNPDKRPTAKTLAEAGRQHRFSSRPAVIKVVSGIMWVLIFIAGAVYLTKELRPDLQPTKEDIFVTTLPLLNSNDADTLKFGLARMDSLANSNYLPALYELFFTYGWYSDPKSLHRKKLLDIKVYTEGSDKYLPVSYQVNNRATSLLNRIIEQEDSLYPHIKAEATYRLAAYYLMTEKVYKRNMERARALLLQSKEYAVKAGDKSLLMKIDDSLKSFE